MFAAGQGDHQLGLGHGQGQGQHKIDDQADQSAAAQTEQLADLAPGQDPGQQRQDSGGGQGR